MVTVVITFCLPPSENSPKREIYHKCQQDSVDVTRRSTIDASMTSNSYNIASHYLVVFTTYNFVDSRPQGTVALPISLSGKDSGESRVRVVCIHRDTYILHWNATSIKGSRWMAWKDELNRERSTSLDITMRLRPRLQRNH